MAFFNPSESCDRMNILINDPKAIWYHLFENSVVGIALVDSRGKFVKVNPKLQEILGYTDFELARLTFQEITLPSDIEADEEALNEIKAKKIPSYSMRKRYITKDGRIVWIRLTVHPSFPKNWEPGINASEIYFISQIEEISSAESKLEKLVEKQSEIIDHYTTQITNILGQIQSFIEKSEQEKNSWSVWKFIDTHAQWIVPTMIMIVTFFVTTWRAQIIREYEVEKIIREVRADNINPMPRATIHEQPTN